MTNAFVEMFNLIAKGVTENAIAKGFWTAGENCSIPTKLCLMHSELSEALEAVRNGNPPDNHIPEFSGLEAELADVVIRIMDLSHKKDLRVAEAILAKIEINAARPVMHGRKEF